MTLSAVTAVLATPLAAQYSQYTVPGARIYDAESRQQRLEVAYEKALWHFGRLALDPYLGLSDLSYLERGASSSGDATSDWTVSASAGLRAYVPVGSKTTLALFALPEYVWFKENEDARRLNQRFGIGSFTYLNRLGVEVTARRQEDLSFVTIESADRLAWRSDQLGVDLEIPVGRRIALIGGGTWARSEYDLDEDASLEADYASLGYDSSQYRAGLKLYLGTTLSLTADYGETEADFDEGTRDQSSSGDVWRVGLGWRRAKTGASISVQRSDLRPEPGSKFEGFEGETWSGEISWAPRERFSFGVYAQRNLAFSLEEEESFYLDDRLGVRLGIGIGWRLRLSMFGEDGTLDYTEGELSLSERTDELRAWGAELQLPLGRRFQIRTGFRRTEVESELPGRGYRMDEITGTLGFGGSANATWF